MDANYRSDTQAANSTKTWPKNGSALTLVGPQVLVRWISTHTLFTQSW